MLHSVYDQPDAPSSLPTTSDDGGRVTRALEARAGTDGDDGIDINTDDSIRPETLGS